MAKKLSRTARLWQDLRGNWQLVTLCFLLAATFFMGGGARGDILSLVILRPIGVICLMVGLFGMTRYHWASYRLPLGIMAAIIALIAVHLVPLPPFIWENLPGRAIAVEAGSLVGLEGIWRPVSLVPFRAWNALHAMLIPAAAMVLAVQLRPDQHRTVFKLVLVMAAIAGFLAVLQAGSGFNRSFYLYRITNTTSPTGLFANRNHFAALLCIVIPMLALLASRARGANKTIIQVAAGGAALVTLLLIFAAGSRGGVAFALLGIAAGGLIWRGGPGRVKRRQGGKSWVAPAFGAVVAVLFTAGLAVMFARSEALDRLASTDAVEENRFAVWRVTFANLWEYMPFGSGIGSFVEIFNIYEPADMLEYNYWNHAHNDWLEWLLEGGIPAVIVMVVAIAAWAVKTRGLVQKLYSGQFAIQLGVVGSASILILGLWSLVDYPLRVPSLACLAAVAAVWMIVPGVARDVEAG